MCIRDRAYLINNESILEKVYYKNGVLADSIIYDNFYGIENEGDIYTCLLYTSI